MKKVQWSYVDGTHYITIWRGGSRWHIYRATMASVRRLIRVVGRGYSIRTGVTYEVTA